MADLFIVGQFDGVASTTAVSIGSQVMHMLTVMIVGLAMGTTVTIGRAVGAGDSKKSIKRLWEIPRFCPGVSYYPGRSAAVSGSADRKCDVNTHRSGRWNDPLSDDLFYRNSFYHCI